MLWILPKQQITQIPQLIRSQHATDALMKATCSIKLPHLLFLLKWEGQSLIITFRFVGVALKTHIAVRSPQYLSSVLWSILECLKSPLSSSALFVSWLLSRSRIMGRSGGKDWGTVSRRQMGGRDLQCSLVELCGWFWQRSPVATPIKLYRI